MGFIIATRGSALALAQSNLVLDRCRRNFPALDLNSKLSKQPVINCRSLISPIRTRRSTKGLFTRNSKSLSWLAKPLCRPQFKGPAHRTSRRSPSQCSKQARGCTRRPHSSGSVVFGAQGYSPHTRLSSLKTGAVIATGSTRRQAQLLSLRPDLKPVPIRGNVGTRIRKPSNRPSFTPSFWPWPD